MVIMLCIAHLHRLPPKIDLLITRDIDLWRDNIANTVNIEVLFAEHTNIEVQYRLNS